MRILGIIAEYDPFHRGHERHLRLAKQIVQPDFTYVVMSSCFKQRGDLAMMAPADRTECALTAGADAVFALPVGWTVRDAEHYATGAVSLLASLGTTHLAFGAETADVAQLAEIADRLENPTAALRNVLRESLREGYGYPKALSLAVGRENEKQGKMLSMPNNILAISYLRAILRLRAEILPVAVGRNGNYHAETVHPGAPSASSLRDSLYRGNYSAVWSAVPAESQRIIRNAFISGRISRSKVLDSLTIGCLREMSREEARKLPDISEGLEIRLLEYAKRAHTRDELLDMVSSRRYPKARISRICTAALLGMSSERVNGMQLPQKAVLLGLRKNHEMTALWRDKAGLISTAWDDEMDLRAWRIWAQCADQPATFSKMEKVVVRSP